MSMSPPSFFRRPPGSTHDPFRDHKMWDAFQNFDFLPHHPPFHNEISPVMSAHVEWKETPEAHQFIAHLPGIKKEDVKVEIEDDRVLYITCERKMSKDDKTEMEHRMVRTVGNFVKCYKLPENARTDKMKATLENGVLCVVVPKEHVSRNSHRRIIALN